MTRLIVLSFTVSLLLVHESALAATPLSFSRYSPDTTVTLDGTTLEDHDAGEDDLAGLVTPVNIGPIPGATAVTAYHALPNGDALLSFDTTVSLPGGVTADSGDVVRFDGTDYFLHFDASANGVPAGVIVDAVSAMGPGDLFLSFDVTVMFGGVTAADEDLVRLFQGTVTLFFDGSTAGIDTGLDLDGAHCIDSNGHLLASFDAGGTVGGAAFDDEDVLEFDPATGVWELVYDGAAEHGNWPAADLEALFVEPSDPAEEPIPPEFSGLSGNGTSGNGIDPGSQRIFGEGTAHGKSDDMCLAVYEAGANGIPDSPPGSVDDELLGTGGTDAMGNWVDSGENPGIPLNRPLEIGDVIFVTDLCEGLTGQLVLVSIPIPVLGPFGLLAVALAMVLIGGLRLRHRRG